VACDAEDKSSIATAAAPSELAKLEGRPVDSISTFSVTFGLFLKGDHEEDPRFSPEADLGKSAGML